MLNLSNNSIQNSLSNNTPNNRSSNNSVPNSSSNILSSKNSGVLQTSSHSNSVLNSSSHSSNTPNNRINNSTPSNNSNILSNKNSRALHSSSNRSNMPNSNSTRLSHALKSSSVWCRAAGSSTAPKTGNQTTAPGNNVAATAVIASLTTDTRDTLGRSMASESTGFPSWWLADIRVSSTRVIGLVSLTHGRGPGQITGMTPMMSMFLTSTTGTTCITAGHPRIGIAFSIGM